MKKIMIVHAEGNLNVNPSLNGIVSILCERGWQVHYYCPRREDVVQEAPRGATVVFLEGNRLLLADRYNLVIGVDRDGIIAASQVARFLGVPHGFICYEIFFASEAGLAFKQPEIDACTALSFAVCQGGERSRQLSIENRIPRDRIIDIPVAGRGIQKRIRSPEFRTGLGVPTDKRIVLYMGSIVSKWAMVDELVQSTQGWGEEWVLLLHHRYGGDQGAMAMRRYYAQVPRIYFTSPETLPFARLPELVGGVDLGAALYSPTDMNMYEGNNLRYLGLSSGKIATYLQHGVPILVNDIGEMSDYVDQYRLGIHVHSLDELPERLRNIRDADLDLWGDACYRFFEQKLDLDAHITPLLKVLEDILAD